MAEQDIPEYVEFTPGDLIRADDQNTIQRRIRSSIRAHRHALLADAPADDASPEDHALQIATDEIADGAVTTAKLAPGAITTDAIPDGAISTAKLGQGAVTSEKLANGAVSADKLGPDSVGSDQLADGAVKLENIQFANVGNGSINVAANTTVTLMVAQNETKQKVYFPTVGVSGGSAGEIEVSLVYRPGSSQNEQNVFIRLRNSGAQAASVIWRVSAFAS